MAETRFAALRDIGDGVIPCPQCSSATRLHPYAEDPSLGEVDCPSCGTYMEEVSTELIQTRRHTLRPEEAAWLEALSRDKQQWIDHLLSRTPFSSPLGVCFVIDWSGGVGRNPMTGADMALPPSSSAHFLSSQELIAATLQAPRFDHERVRQMIEAADIVKLWSDEEEPEAELLSVSTGRPIPEPQVHLELSALCSLVREELAASGRCAIQGLGLFRVWRAHTEEFSGNLLTFTHSPVLSVRLNPAEWALDA